MKNIVVIGMPGCGKSSLGVILAKLLGKSFCDVDLFIQKNQQKKLQQIIDENGVEAFLEIEEQEILNLNVTDTVIATGGSAVLKKASIRHLKKNGILVYLQLPFEEIQKRVYNLETRGIAMKKNETLKTVYDERTPLYEAYADIVIDCLGLTMDETLTLLQKKISEIL